MVYVLEGTQIESEYVNDEAVIIGIYTRTSIEMTAALIKRGKFTQEPYSCLCAKETQF